MARAGPGGGGAAHPRGVGRPAEEHAVGEEDAAVVVARVRADLSD